jgi:Ca2+-binding EF-hand superfamily protein
MAVMVVSDNQVDYIKEEHFHQMIHLFDRDQDGNLDLQE